VYQLLNYVINERLKKIVEPANILKPGQSGGRQGCCVGINMQKKSRSSERKRPGQGGIIRRKVGKSLPQIT